MDTPLKPCMKSLSRACRLLMRLMACTVASVRSSVAPSRSRAAGVGPGLVSDDEGALADAAVEHLVGTLLAEHATSGHHKEGRARIVDAGDDAHLLLAQTALRGLLAALAGRAGHGAFAVAFVAVAEVRLVYLHAVADDGVE